MPGIEPTNPLAVDEAVAAPPRVVLAERGTRLAAFLLDAAPALIAGLGIGIAAMLTMPFLFSRASAGYAPFIQADMSTDRDMSRAVAVALAISAVVLVAWCVWNCMLVHRQGQTWGKQVMGIRIVRTDGRRMSFARFFWLRNVAYGACCLVPVIGWLLRLVDKLLIFRPSRRCLHDMMADTIVVTAASSTAATLAATRA